MGGVNGHGALTGRVLGFARGNAIALLALFVALGGTATALQRNSVGTKELKRNAVKAPQLSGNAVRPAKIAGNAVRPRHIASNAVGSPKIAGGAVTQAKIAAAAVGGGQLANGAVGSAKIAGGAIGADKLAPGALGSAGEVITVPRQRISVPGDVGFNEVVLLERPPFTVTGRCNRSASSSSATVYVQTTVDAISQPIGNPPTTINVTAGAPRLVAPAVSSSQAHPAGSRGAAGLWAITEAGRYVNLGIFIAREGPPSSAQCTFGASGFAN